MLDLDFALCHVILVRGHVTARFLRELFIVEQVFRIELVVARRVVDLDVLLEQMISHNFFQRRFLFSLWPFDEAVDAHGARGKHRRCQVVENELVVAGVQI